MSLSKQERAADRLSSLDFIGGHLKIGIAKGRPHPRIDAKIEKWTLNVKTFFSSKIGKPAEIKEMEKAMRNVREEEEEEEEVKAFDDVVQSIDWPRLPDRVRTLVVHKMPLQSRLNLAATSKTDRQLVQSAKVECKLFVVDDVDRRTVHLLRYPDLHWMVFTRPGKRYFLNFLCDWGHEIAICFCEERRPFEPVATKIYWLTPSGRIKKTCVPNADPYELTVRTAAHFFSLISGETRRCSVSMRGWPADIFAIPELRNAHVIGSSYDDVESIHKTYDFFEPFSFDVHMRKTARRYTWPSSLWHVTRHGLREWIDMRDRDRKLCDAMLDKDLRVLILRDSFVSQEKMREFVARWQCGDVPDVFLWWAISTRMPVDADTILDGIGHTVLEEKYGPKLITKGKHDTKPKCRGTAHAVTYQIDSRLGPNRKATLVVRENMVMFANTNCAPNIDESGLVTFKSRYGITEAQF